MACVSYLLLHTSLDQQVKSCKGGTLFWALPHFAASIWVAFLDYFNAIYA